MLQSLPLILHDRCDDRKFLQARSLQFCIQMIAKSLLIGLYLLRSDHSLSYQRFCIDHCRIVVSTYNLIQGRLCESRFVPLIMSIFSITNYIDKDIMPKAIRYSIAKSIARTTASVSSELTCSTGAWNPLATSVQ